jgi:hypothetical protein
MVEEERSMKAPSSKGGSEMKGILKVGVISLVAGVILGAILWSLGFTVSFFPTVKAQSLSHTYLPLVMKNYPEPTRTPAPNIGLPSDKSLSTDLVVVGELKNYSQDYYTVGDVKCKLYNSQGVVLVQYTAFPFSYSLGPGDTTAFRCSFYVAPTEWSSYRITFSPALTPYRPLNLTVTDITTTYDEYYRLEIRGFVNNQDIHTAYPTVWVAFYNAAGNIINAAYDYLYVSLDPEESSAFSITVEGPITGYTTYVVRAYDDYWTWTGTASQTEPYREAWQEWRMSQGE